MNPPFQFEAVYDPEIVREAAWTFAKRRFLGDRRLLVTAAILILLCSGSAWWWREPWPIVAAVAAPVVVVGLFFAVWLSHRSVALRKLRALDAMRARFTFDDSGLSVSSKAGSMSLVWAALEEVWIYPRFWIVATAVNAFFTVPIETASSEAVAFARSKLGKRIG